MRKDNASILFIRISLVLLIAGVVFGTIGSFSFLNAPGFKYFFPFYKLRPLHVSSVVFWILLSATGIVFSFLPGSTGKPLLGNRWLKVALYIWAATLILIFTSYFSGTFGGREYWEYPPIYSLPLIASWLIISVVFFKNLLSCPSPKPVYLWMWATGFICFTITFSESYLWIFPWFRNNIIRDITVQWKANGSMVGAWNMLVYGAGICLMERTSDNKSLSRNTTAFVFYYLGLANLLFNWGHHTYLLPAAPWIQYVSYGISMTEWLIFLRIIRNWRSTMKEIKAYSHDIAYKFIGASEFWIFANLALALLMSIPAVNVYTHGTHITVAHAMGATVGINTFILLACIAHILKIRKDNTPPYTRNILNTLFWLINLSLFIFWIALIGAGIAKGHQVYGLKQHDFAQVMTHVYPYIYVFAFAGIGLTFGLCIIAVIFLRRSK